MKHLLTTALIAAAIPAHAGGPVIIEDAAEAAPMARPHDVKLGGVVVGIIAIAALIALANGGGTCNGDPTPEPTPGEC